MRSPGLAALLLAALLAATTPAAQAQDPAPAADAVALLEDGTGDLQVVGPVPATAPSGQMRNMDLTSLAGSESLTSISLTLGVDELAVGTGPALSSVQYRIAFLFGGNQYAIDAYAYDQGGIQAYASLHAYEADEDPLRDYGYYLASIPAVADTAAHTLTFEAPRDLLVDSSGATPYPGSTLEAFQARAFYLDLGTGISISGQSLEFPHMADRMPDTGMGEQPYAVRLGIQQAGDLRLKSSEPFRASNGEASSFVFRVLAANLGEQDIIAEFVPNGVPAGWTVRAPGMLRLAAGEEVEVPVLVQSAFSHQHGSASAFTLELVGQDAKSSVGRIQLGLRYPLIAQPSGHHPTVYLHSQDFGGDPLLDALYLAFSALVGYDISVAPYFNTALPESDENDAGTPVEGGNCGFGAGSSGPVTSTYCWYVPLLPGLEMGLDFDLGATGTYSIPFATTAPQPGFTVQGVLEYFAPGEDDPFGFSFSDALPVATLEPSQSVDLGLQGSTTATGAIVPLEAGDLVPYEQGGQLVLRLEATTARPDNFFLGPKTPPSLVAGGVLTLPLLDYSDPVDTEFDAFGALHVMVDGEADRVTNPGKTLVYGVTVHNAGNETDEVRLTLIGSNLDWAVVAGPERFRLDPDEAVDLQVHVHVPADAADGDRADLVLEVASLSDVASRGLLRLVATADTDAEHPDEAATAVSEPARGSPGPSTVRMALAVLALASVLRRRA